MSFKVNREQAHEFLSYIIDPAHCSELRIFKANFDSGGCIISPLKYRRTVGGWYDDPKKLVGTLNIVKGVSAYITVNPVDARLLGRSRNHAKILEKDGGTHDEDIKCYRWLYIDIDCERPAGVSSTNEELQNCILLRDKILASEPDFKQNSLYGVSGNGCWILLRLDDWPNNDERKQWIVAKLGTLAAKYGLAGRDKTFIDTKTFNPSRVMCIPGTLKTKGEPTPETPWRYVTLDGIGTNIKK